MSSASCVACRACPIVDPVMLTPCGCTVCKADAYPTGDGKRVATCPGCENAVENDYPNKIVKTQVSEASAAAATATLASMMCQVPGHNSPIIAFCHCKTPKAPVCTACLRIEHQACKGTTTVEGFRAENVATLKQATETSARTLKKSKDFFESADRATARIREVREDLNRRMEFVRHELERIHEETQKDLAKADEEVQAAKAKVENDLVTPLHDLNRQADNLLDATTALDLVVDRAAKLASELQDLSHDKALTAIIHASVPFGERPRPEKPKKPVAPKKPAAAAAAPEKKEEGADAAATEAAEGDAAPAATEETKSAPEEPAAKEEQDAAAEAAEAAPAAVAAVERVLKVTHGLKAAFDEILKFTAPRRPYAISEAKQFAADEKAAKEKAAKDAKAALAAAAAAKPAKKAPAAAAAPDAASLLFDRSSKFLVRDVLRDRAVDLGFSSSREGTGYVVSKAPWNGKIVHVKLGALHHKLLFGVVGQSQLKERDINAWKGINAITTQDRLVFLNSQPTDTPEYNYGLKANSEFSLFRTTKGDVVIELGGRKGSKKILVPSPAGSAYLVVAAYERINDGESSVTVSY